MAFLKRIEAKGFKSFAHKTIVEFTDGLTIIVGPNGSGKSNINDAIKWVLGERSKKTLRASSATDMIFSGSDKEKEADMAEVTLVFNNEDKILDINYSEVSITRRSYRHQDHNEYLINKNLVRRKDIKNLFLDTGLGNTDLSIISQGSVSKVTEAKPDDLKELLNEASGVARYKQQKDESLRKLEKVNQNLDIFTVKLKELERQINPLKKAKEKAEKYLSIKEKLSEIELPLIKKQLDVEIKRKDELEKILSDSDAEKTTANNKVEELKTKQNDIQTKILELEAELFSLQSKQSELVEKKTSATGDSAKQLESQIKEVIKSIADVKRILSEAQDNEIKTKKNFTKLKDDEFEANHLKEKLQFKLNSLEYELSKLSTSNYDRLGKGTRTILENQSVFDTVYGIVSDLVSYKDQYDIAINVALGNKLSNLVVSDEKVIKQAIAWLKKNNYGSATFIPANKVQPRFLANEYELALTNVEGYIGTLESVINTKSIYKKVIASLAGNILLFDNIDHAMKAAKLTGYKFMLVTLEGDIVFPGFTVRGGQNRNTSTLGQKDIIQKSVDNIRTEFNETLDKRNKLRDLITAQTTLISSTQNEQVRSLERITYLETNLSKLLDQYKINTGKEFDVKQVKVSSSGSTLLSLEGIKNRIKTIQSLKQNIQKDLMSLQKREDVFRKLWQTSIESNTDATIEFNKISSNIQMNIEILNKDYKMTLEALEDMELPKLKIKEEKASTLRLQYREEISELGYVDVESVERYNEIAGDYEELKANTLDLSESREKLLTTIETMDKEMLFRLKETFKNVNVKFNSTFNILFRGGRAELEYIEPDNILESGVEIVAKAPGKAVKNIALYSGGEKALIALSLIFAINEVRKLPMLLLDEVEAALDEANVERFAKFAKKLNENTQLIIVTHRPGTMERADVLYGVTMQEKGITKIVSVKLEEAVDLTT